MNTNEWITFDGRRSTADLELPIVTIQKRGTLGLNSAAYKLLGEPERVIYLKHPAGDRFGIRKADAKTPNSYPLRKQVSGRSFVVSAALFLRWIGVSITEARGCPLHLEDGIGVVSLKE